MLPINQPLQYQIALLYGDGVGNKIEREIDREKPIRYCTNCKHNVPFYTIFVYLYSYSNAHSII